VNIYELEKQATPGPWSRCPHTIDGVLGYPTGDPMGSRTVSIGSCCNIPITQRSENAALIAHCRNNFMKALEALKRVASLDILVYGMSADFHREVRQLVAELEEVK